MWPLARHNEGADYSVSVGEEGHSFNASFRLSVLEEDPPEQVKGAANSDAGEKPDERSPQPIKDKQRESQNGQPRGGV